MTIDSNRSDESRPRPVVTVYCLQCSRPESEKDRELKTWRHIGGLRMTREGLHKANYGRLEVDCSVPASMTFDSAGNVSLTLDS